MSRALTIRTANKDYLKKLEKELQVQQEPSKYAKFAVPKIITTYSVENGVVHIPFAYDTNLPTPERKSFPNFEAKFTGKLREHQLDVKSEAIQTMNKSGSVIISCYPGFGKTCLGIYIACQVKLTTLILCHRVVLIEQWKKAILSFCPNARVQIINAKCKLLPSDFYIINAQNVKKFPREFFKNIGFLIVDELHIIMAEKISFCMTSFTPRYVLGLSATPYRNDGLDILLDLYCGKHKIERKLVRNHNAYFYQTGFTPEMKLNKMGKVDWGSVLASQCSNVERNELIIKLIKYFSDRVFIVLSKRVEQARYLVDRLKEEKEDVTSLIGSEQTFCEKSRILVGIGQKAGVGFDHPRLNAMILASDFEDYFIQYLGRIFRTETGEPMIIDLVDNNPILKKHFETRKNIYTEHGGKIRNFKIEFPDFN